mgnify:CR=1 FL=1
MKSKIKSWMDNHQNSGINLLQRFVQCDSVQGNEVEVQRLVEAELEQLEMKVDRFFPGPETINHPAFCANRTDFSQSPNIVGVWRGSGGGRSLLLNGHIDVVPPGNRSDWEEDPYSGLVKDGRLFGRGATDMKGGNTSMLLALKCIKELGIVLKGDVIFESVVEEESGGTGTLAAIERGYQADAALIPEPTKMKIFPKQQGSMWFRLNVSGRGAHGGTRYEGVSAIEKTMLILTAIQKLEQKRNDAITDPLYQNIPIPVPINIGKISGGDWPSSVPDQVVVEGRMGVIPGEELDHAKEEMTRALKEVDDAWLSENPVGIEWFGARWLPGEVAEDHPLVTIIRRRYKEITGEEVVVEASPWGTDGGLLQEVGQTPSIVFGPGETAVAHFPNEYIEIEKMMLAAELYVHIIMEWCGFND